MTVSLSARSEAFQAAARNQPGCTPYENHRPIYVRKHSAGQSLGSLLRHIEPYDKAPELLDEHRLKGWIKVDQKSPSLEQVLVAGNAIELVLPNTTEPPIGTDLRVVHEDTQIIVVSKPSPLPVHPCGRYNLNSLVLLAREAWPDITLKPVHRLDANTTGVLAFAKTTEAARWLMTEFKEQRVKKEYLARVHGVPEQETFSIKAAIEAMPSKAGTRKVGADGQAAWTDVNLERTFDDGSSLLRVKPRTGRTNQIRLHLLSVGLPIVGDVAYGAQPDMSRGMTQTNAALGLHAHRLTFKHPTTETSVCFESPPPHWFGQALEPDA